LILSYSAGILLESIPIGCDRNIWEPWRLVRAQESPETELFKIARVLPSPLGLVRHGIKCKTQKERVGEAKNNDHNLLLRPRGPVF